MTEKIEKQKISLPCPKGCSRSIDLTYYEICNRREAKCSDVVQSINLAHLKFLI